MISTGILVLNEPTSLTVVSAEEFMGMETADSVNNLKIWDKNPNSSLPNGTSRFHFLINDAEKTIDFILTFQKKMSLFWIWNWFFFGNSTKVKTIPSSGSNRTSMSIDSMVGQGLLLSPILLTIKTVVSTVSSSSVISGNSDGSEGEVSELEACFLRCNCFRSAL